MLMQIWYIAYYLKKFCFQIYSPNLITQVTKNDITLKYQITCQLNIKFSMLE